MKTYSIRAFFLVLITLVSCGGGGDDPAPTPEVKNPEKATLVSPDNNKECTTGTVNSDTEATVIFDWTKATNATKYKVYLKNLETGVVTNHSASTDKLDLKIKRGTPYSWYVVSESNLTSNTATSETFKFYLAGNGTVNYAPFPAELVSPLQDSEVSSSTITLEWSGNDVDYDIKNYDVYLDKNTNPTTMISTVTTQKLENQAVTATSTYYWKVVTRDEVGNTSSSQVFSFKTN